MDELTTQLVVLAGGKGSRLGSDKSRILLDGVPILKHLAHRLAWRGPTLLIKSNSQSFLPGDDCFDQVVEDQYVEQGPLGGIATALAVSTAGALLVVPLDMPRLGRDHLLTLLAHSTSDEIVSFVRYQESGEEVHEPFPLLIYAAAKQTVCEHFRQGRRSVKSLFRLPCSRQIPSPPEWKSTVWCNINYVADLRGVNARLEDNPE